MAFDFTYLQIFQANIEFSISASLAFLFETTFKSLKLISPISMLCKSRPKLTECTSLGIAFLSGLASGYWNSMENLKNIWHSEKIFTPQNKDQHLISNWNKKMKILHLKQKKY